MWKIGLSLLISTFGHDILPETPKRKMVSELIEKNINSPLCCSVGRLFDGVSSLLGFSQSISTEAEAAQRLEEAALRSNTDLSFPMDIEEGGPGEPLAIINQALIMELWDKLQEGIHPDDLARAFHNSIADVTIQVLRRLRESSGINKVVLSGGVFHNRLLLSLIEKYIISEKFELLLPKELPFNDGAIAVGQIVAAKARLFG